MGGLDDLSFYCDIPQLCCCHWREKMRGKRYLDLRPGKRSSRQVLININSLRAQASPRLSIVV